MTVDYNRYSNSDDDDDNNNNNNNNSNNKLAVQIGTHSHRLPGRGNFSVMILTMHVEVNERSGVAQFYNWLASVSLGLNDRG